MNTNDLVIFLTLAETENMQQASLICNKTPSVISKSLKRLETHLGIKLFSRIGKNIQLNDVGKKFRINAAKIVNEVKQTTNEFSGISTSNNFTVSAPAILLIRWASMLAQNLQQAHNNCSVNFDVQYEQQALNQLKQGSADISIITASLQDQVTSDMYFIELPQVTMQLSASKNHPLVKDSCSKAIKITADDLLEHTFVTPNTSPFCGENRGIGCDGWHNDIYPRKLNLVVNDYSVLGQLVKSGQALAYLPDYCAQELNLVPLSISDAEVQYHEKLLLISFQKSLIDLFNS